MDDATDQAPLSIAVDDLDGDGTPDLAVASGTETLSLLAALAVVDVTGDGKPDVLISNGPTYIATCLP